MKEKKFEEKKERKKELFLSDSVLLHSLINITHSRQNRFFPRFHDLCKSSPCLTNSICIINDRELKSEKFLKTERERERGRGEREGGGERERRRGERVREGEREGGRAEKEEIVLMI